MFFLKLSINKHSKVGNVYKPPGGNMAVPNTCNTTKKILPAEHTLSSLLLYVLYMCVNLFSDTYC